VRYAARHTEINDILARKICLGSSNSRAALTCLEPVESDLSASYRTGHDAARTQASADSLWLALQPE
jgi:hypothetical protein